MRSYLGLLVVALGVVALLTAWASGLSRISNAFLLVPLGLIVGGTLLHVMMQKQSGGY